MRALDLLGRFLDLGAWAVNLALSVGIFPYVLKLLQSSARELRPLLVFIWAKVEISISNFDDNIGRPSFRASDPGGGSELSARSSQGPGVGDQESQVFPDSAPGPGDAGAAQDLGRVRVVQCGENLQTATAAVMALGTFINSCKTRREHENTLVSAHYAHPDL